MDKLFPPKSARSNRRSSSDFKTGTLNTTLREKQLRKLSQDQNSSTILDIGYVYKPQIQFSTTDTQEVSLQLSHLRKNFDKQCNEWNKRDSFLNVLKSEMEKITSVEKKKIADKEIKLLEIKTLEEDIEKAKKLQIAEDDNKEIFLHLLDRMRTTIVHLKYKSQGFKVSLHEKSFTLLTEKENFKKTKESRARTANACVRLKRIIDIQTYEEKKELEELEKNVEKRKIVSSNRYERRKKQGEIIEKAIIDSQSSTLEDIREKYFMNKLWYSVSTLRFEKEKKTSKMYEDAYTKIKLATGISDVPLFVQKFLTREKNYRQMLASVKKKESELSEYKEKIDSMQDELEKFNSKRPEIHIDQNNKIELTKLRREIRELELKKLNIIQVHDKISKWITKMKSKLILNFPEVKIHSKLLGTENTIISDIITIKTIVSSALKFINKEKVTEMHNKKENLRSIISEIPEYSRSPNRYSTIIDKKDLVNFETDYIEDTFKKIRYK